MKRSRRKKHGMKEGGGGEREGYEREGEKAGKGCVGVGGEVEAERGIRVISYGIRGMARASPDPSGHLHHDDK